MSASPVLLLGECHLHILPMSPYRLRYTNLRSFAIGIVGDAGVRGTAQQPRLFVGMILILIFAEVLGKPRPCFKKPSL